MLLVILYAIGLSAPLPAPDAHAYRAVVRRVIDGDTIVADVELGWGLWMVEQPIRLKRCWAAELKEPHGPVAKRSLETLLDNDREADGFQPGAEVLFTSGTAKSLGEREKYGRLLGEVFLDGVNVGAEQVRLGHARSTP